MAGLLTHHALCRAVEMGVGTDEIRCTVDDPELTYPSPPQHGPGRMISVRDRLAVVHTSDLDQIITVLWRGRTGRA